MAWFDRNNTNNEGGGDGNKNLVLTDEHFERIATDVAKKLEKPLNDSLTSASQAALDANPILKRLKDSMDANETRRQEAERARTTSASQTQQTEFDKAYDELEPEVRTVLDARFSQANQSAMRAEARETRRGIFEDIESHPYYTGDLKKKIDEMIEKEPLENQINPLLVRNAYKIIVADHMKDIQEGKVRSRLSSATGSSTTTTTKTDANALPALTDEDKRAAKNFGIKEEDWAKTKKDLITEGVLGV
jgi:phage I-like protein